MSNKRQYRLIRYLPIISADTHSWFEKLRCTLTFEDKYWEHQAKAPAWIGDT